MELVIERLAESPGVQRIGNVHSGSATRGSPIILRHAES